MPNVSQNKVQIDTVGNDVCDMDIVIWLLFILQLIPATISTGSGTP